MLSAWVILVWSGVESQGFGLANDSNVGCAALRRAAVTVNDPLAAFCEWANFKGWDRAAVRDEIGQDVDASFERFVLNANCGRSNVEPASGLVGRHAGVC
ncbi:hypothetical protein [Pseudomonas sp. Kh13]|uniref:hypothetical protein n=1 Tax=Pseudomonas sp. Kh13 TaxID=2093744 RepID=UPI0015B57BCC|nr:hypothetical protein [Pseudomonas sp. Kh13]